MSLDNGQDALIDPYGGCRNVKSYQMAEIVYDATVSFCNRFFHYLLRTHDQKVQAARGGKQTIAEGCMQEEVEIKNMASRFYH